MPSTEITVGNVDGAVVNVEQEETQRNALLAASVLIMIVDLLARVFLFGSQALLHIFVELQAIPRLFSRKFRPRVTFAYALRLL